MKQSRKPIQEGDALTSEMCRRYESGESLAQIGRAFDCTHMTVKMRLRKAGITLRSREDGTRLRMDAYWAERMARRYGAGGDAT